MNSALVLIILLLAVPLQLLITHYLNTTYSTIADADSAVSDADSVGSMGRDGNGGIQTVRKEALHK